MKTRFYLSIALALVMFSGLQSGVSEAKSVPIVRKIEGSFLTNVAGSSVTQPPYIQVMRSREGFDYAINGFERLKNRITQSRINYLKKQLKGLDFTKYMLVGVFSQPMDNYKMTLNRISVDDYNSSIEVSISYRHKIQNLRIPPKKSIHYVLVVVRKSDLPVILQATELVSSKNRKPAKLITVTGRLMDFSGGSDLQLVPVVIKRGSKNSYYIKGEQAGPLRQYISKVVTLQGTVSRERNSPYEWDLTVMSIVKIYP